MATLKLTRFPAATRARALGVVALTAAALGLPGAAVATGEYDLKAAFLLNFVRLVEWPDAAFASDAAPLTIGLFGEDPFGGSLARRFEGVGVGGRTLEVRRVQAADEARACQLVFVPVSQVDRFGALRDALDGSNVLLVSEAPDLARRGAAINFFSDGGRIRFEVNREVARAAQLKLSARLLRLARIVEKDG